MPSSPKRKNKRVVMKKSKDIEPETPAPPFHGITIDIERCCDCAEV